MVRRAGVDPEQPAHGSGRHVRRPRPGDHLHHVAVAGNARSGAGRGLCRCGPGDGRVPGVVYAGAVLRRCRHARLPPGVPGRQAGGRTHDRVPDLPVRRPRGVGRTGDPVAVFLQPPHHDERDAARQGHPRSSDGSRARAAAGARRARLWPGPGGAVAACVPRPRRGATNRIRRPRADHRRGSGHRRDRRHSGRSGRGPHERRGDPRVGRLRMGPGTLSGVPAWSDVAPGVDRDEHRRWPPDGDEGRRDVGEHARGVVDPGGVGARRGEPDGTGPDQRSANAAPFDHGQQAGTPVHERGRQLQRVRRRLPRRGRVALRVRQPAVLARLRRELRRQVRVPGRVRRRGQGGAGLGAARRHTGGTRGGDRRRPEGPHRHDRPLERPVRRRQRSRLRPRRQRLRSVVGRPVPEGQAGGDTRAARRRPVLRGRDPQRLPRHEGWPEGQSARPGDRPRRQSDRRALRRRQRHGLTLRDDLRRSRRHARAGDGVRLHRRPPRHQARESQSGGRPLTRVGKQVGRDRGFVNLACIRGKPG